jgi:hypothetical protein
VAQISFGVHLLAKGLAKSELDVMKILQRHVDELDTFLERTTEDLVLAHDDIRERLGYLRFPLENLKTFDEMLGDPSFRQSVVQDSQALKHIIERSEAAMGDALKDTQKGTDAVETLGRYLMELGNEWQNRPSNLDAVYQVMAGNIEGWDIAFAKLHKASHALAGALNNLNGAVLEMERRVSLVSKNNMVCRKPPSAKLVNDATILTFKQSSQHKRSKRAKPFRDVFRRPSVQPSSPQPSNSSVLHGNPSNHWDASNSTMRRADPKRAVHEGREKQQSESIHSPFMEKQNGAHQFGPKSSIHLEDSAIQSAFGVPLTTPILSEPQVKRQARERHGVEDTHSVTCGVYNSTPLRHLIPTPDILPVQRNPVELKEKDKGADSLTALPFFDSRIFPIKDHQTNYHHRNYTDFHLPVSIPSVSTPLSNKQGSEAQGSPSPRAFSPAVSSPFVEFPMITSLSPPDNSLSSTGPCSPTNRSFRSFIAGRRPSSKSSRDRLGLGVRIGKDAGIESLYRMGKPSWSEGTATCNLEDDGTLEYANVNPGRRFGDWFIYRKQTFKRLFHTSPPATATATTVMITPRQTHQSTNGEHSAAAANNAGHYATGRNHGHSVQSEPSSLSQHAVSHRS